MKKIKVIQIFSLVSLLVILLSACNRNDCKENVVTLVDKNNNQIEKGLLINGKREGYWAIFDTNYVIMYDIQYRNDIPNGKTTYYNDGAISIEAEIIDGKRNGKYTSYHKYPIIASQGYVKNGEKIGEWKTYVEDGRLNKIILFEKDTFKIILDNMLE